MRCFAHAVALLTQNAGKQNMKAIQVQALGGPEVMQLVEIPTPTPGPGEVLVKLAAAGVNFSDIYKRSGQYATQVPYIPGEEGSGIVAALGPNVQDVQVGDHVAFAHVSGAYAEYVVAPTPRLVPVPADLDVSLAAAVMLQGMTAHYLTHSTYPLHAGETALVHAAAGGVGLLLVQMAKQLGARVIATVSTEEKAQMARGAGADEVILYSQEDFVAAAKKLTAQRGVDVVYDSVGKTTFEQSLQCLRPRGMLVIFGQSSGAVPPFDVQQLNAKGSLFLTRPTLANYIADRSELLARANDLFTWMAHGQLKVHIGATFPLAEAVSAHQALAGRATTGKVLLLP